MEVTFEEARAHRGMATQRQGNERAMARATPALVSLYALMTLTAHLLLEKGATCVRSTAWALVAARATAAHVLIDHDDVGKPQPAGLLGAGILPPLALRVRADVMTRRLADIDVGVTWEMARVNLGGHGYTPRSGYGG